MKKDNFSHFVKKYARIGLAINDLCEDIFTEKELIKMDKIWRNKKWWGLVQDRVRNKIERIYRKPAP